MKCNSKMTMFPSFAIEDSYKLKVVAGIDEAGRGPLFGDVYAGCVVIVDRNFLPQGINDSKKIKEADREEIFDKICELEKQGKILFGVGIGSVEEIDKINIRETTKLAMQRSYENLIKKHNLKIDLVLVDGNFVPKIDTETDFIVKGDTKSLSIATASIIAKVSRDRTIREIAKKYPLYNLDKHKGYGTKEHKELIKMYGLTPEHRKSFCKNY